MNIEEKIQDILDTLIDNNEDTIEACKPMVYKGIEFRLNEDSDYDRESGYGFDYTVEFLSDGLNNTAIQQVVNEIVRDTEFVDNITIIDRLHQALVEIYDSELRAYVDELIRDNYLEPGEIHVI